MRKKSACKVPIAKLVWQWTENVSPADITEEHIRTAYRLKLEKCESCRKNCTANPTCLRGLGEAAWLKPGKYQNILDSEINELKNDMRKEGEFVGLRNLGATCYVNTFLQLWFHNLSFRKAVYSYRDDCKEGPFPSTACAHLQLLFGMLQCSKRKNIDPTPFVKCLGLDTDQQQDAQEFSKLLLNLLDRTSEVGNFLCEEFCGEYDYCTKCKNCGNVSKRPSKFYELDLSIQGKKDVKHCLSEFFEEEQLDGENQYHCPNCDQKCDASRRIVIKSFPKTLNLQLLRFVFDKSSWTKKKLSSFLSFPDVLDMSQFVSSDMPEASRKYQLTAVLIHRGPSAYSGHYIAHIKDSSTELWHKFNDEAVGQVKSGKKLDLDALGGDDYEIDLPHPAKKPKVSKNIHTSKDAYMLVYTRKDNGSVKNYQDPFVPPVVKEAVEKDNADFTSTLTNLISEVQARIIEKSNTHTELGVLLKRMLDMEVENLVKDYYWVPTTWIKHMLNGSEEEKNPVSYEKFLCSHGKLNPDKVGGMKCIPVDVGSFFSTMCKVSPPLLKNEMLCHDCVKHKCFILRLKAGLKEDHATVTKLLKDGDNVTNGYMIGRSSLRYWKTMALKKTEEDGGEDAVRENGDDLTSKDEKETKDANENSSSDEQFDFNEDLLCEHGSLAADSKEYRVVSDVVWNIISKYFPGAPSFPSSSPACQICQDKEHDAEQAAQVERVMVAEQKTLLNDLLHNKNRPSYDDLFGMKAEEDCSCQVFYAVSSEFVGKWRDYIHNSSKNDAVSEVQNVVLLCPHNKLLHDPASSFDKDYECDLDDDDDQLSAVLLWPLEWDYISKNFGVDRPISLTKIEDYDPRVLLNGDLSRHEKGVEIGLTIPETASHDNDDTDQKVTANIVVLNGDLSEHCKKRLKWKFDPDLCHECIVGRQLERERSLRVYENREIYVKKILQSDASTFLKDLATDLPNGSSRRKKRARASRAEKKISVTSTWTLKELKIKIMKMFSTPPYDQNIYHNRQKLERDDATLGELNIIPGSFISFIADEPDEKSFEMLPTVPESTVVTEEGFKGTSLLSI